MSSATAEWLREGEVI